MEVPAAAVLSLEVLYCAVCTIVLGGVVFSSATLPLTLPLAAPPTLVEAPPAPLLAALSLRS